MVERLKGPTPNGKQMPTLYLLSKREAVVFTKRAGVPFTGEQNLENLVGAEMTVNPEAESGLEELLRSYGLKIYYVGKG
ncbi:hypothetical protein A2867_04030 [Candidatus Daviesbacteria bacterium RIFCSPHIGHO2_01_FULL_40_11]|uniref:Uncharacterized protein n=1 Tax=Candidatus Daviesbacteria bacterium RIFCSPHIGHO2_01_FULL_40_11 TaxID=1797762 RepID=A0A1F5JFP4_9BACT|nr:MAG: hypothetical protein A2867_04030 [Candidatus Daviesbacteria bacterium RIFCSPHIGHO2_01_FULL_40_11]